MKMTSKKMLGFLMTSALALTGTLALAQDQSPAQQPTTPEGHQRHDRRVSDPNTQAKRMAKKLNLNSDQQTQIAAILTAQHDQMTGLRADTSTTRDDRRAKMQSIHSDTQAKIRGLLTEEQKQSFDQLQQQMRDRQQNRKG